MAVSYEERIKACLECMEACNGCYDACLKEENVKMMADCMRYNRECADICELAAKAMQSDRPFAKQICKLCADICEACGKMCEQHNHANHARNVLNLVLNVQTFAEQWHHKYKNGE